MCMIGAVLSMDLEMEKGLVVCMVRKNGVNEWKGVRMKKVGVKRAV